jgi:hypothetical protein
VNDDAYDRRARERKLRAQSAIELFIVLAIFLSIFVWTGGYASTLDHLRRQTGTVEAEGILRAQFNHASAAYNDRTNVTGNLPCLIIGGEGYGYTLTITPGQKMSLYSSLFAEDAFHVELACATTACPAFAVIPGFTAIEVPACTNHTSGAACYDGLTQPGTVTVYNTACA